MGIGGSDGLMDGVREDAGTQRLIAGGEPLGADQDIRLDAKDVLGSEHMSQSSEAGHDLVRDVEHVMPPADFPRLAVVILGRNHDAELGPSGGKLRREVAVGDVEQENRVPFLALSRMDGGQHEVILVEIRRSGEVAPANLSPSLSRADPHSR